MLGAYGKKGLNPCFNGRHSQRNTLILKCQKSKSRNPLEDTLRGVAMLTL